MVPSVDQGKHAEAVKHQTMLPSQPHITRQGNRRRHRACLPIGMPQILSLNLSFYLAVTDSVWCSSPHPLKLCLALKFTNLVMSSGELVLIAQGSGTECIKCWNL